MDEMEKSKKSLRNAKIANILLNESAFFKKLLVEGMDTFPNRVRSIDIDYENIMTMSEYIEAHPEIDYKGKNSPIFDTIYSVPLKITYSGGAVQEFDAFFDDYATNIATVAHELPSTGSYYNNRNNDSGQMPSIKKQDFSTFKIVDSYNQQCLHLADMLLKKGYSKATIQAIMKMAVSGSLKEMLEIMGNQDRVIPLNEKSIELLAQKYEALVKEGKSPEELNAIRIEDLMIADETRKQYEQKTESYKQQEGNEEGKEEKEDKDVPVEPEPVEDKQEEQTEKEQEEEKSLANGVSVDKISNALRAANLHASQVQDIIFVPHPKELNQYLSGEYLINNDEEITIIKLRSSLKEPSRYEILQGEGENIRRVETRGRYNDTLNKIFPEKSEIGTNAYNIVENEKDDQEIKMELTCDGKAQRIDLSQVPISQFNGLDKKVEAIATLKEIQDRAEKEKSSAEAIKDPVERHRALAKVHEDTNKELIGAQIQGQEEEPIIDENIREIIEHLAEADRIEKEREAAKTEEEPEVSAAAVAMLGVGAAAVGVTAAGQLSNEQLGNLLADIGAPERGPIDDHSEGRMRLNPYDHT